jgi:hypothetical protein
MLLDPVAAGLWPHPRQRIGLGPLQRGARWIVAHSNPSAGEALHSRDARAVLLVLLRLSRRFEQRSLPGSH